MDINSEAQVEEAAKDNGTVLPDLGMAAMLLHRIRCFTNGAVIGSKAFVNEAFAAARARFEQSARTAKERCRAARAWPKACCRARGICGRARKLLLTIQGNFADARQASVITLPESMQADNGSA